jgi:hypothetical protein
MRKVLRKLSVLSVLSVNVGNPMIDNLAEELARVAVDASEHPAEAVAAMLKGGAIILARTFGHDKAFEIMMEVMAETERDWIKAKTGSDVMRH